MSLERLAATYSRGVYKTTTIGKTVFDGRVRNGNGSDHSFMATKKFWRTATGGGSRVDTTSARFEKELRRTGDSLKIAHRRHAGSTIRELKSHPFSLKKKKESDQAARPISISPLNGLLRLHA